MEICGGFCQKKLEANQEPCCFLSASDISMEEYALIQFQISLIKETYENIFLIFLINANQQLKTAVDSFVKLLLFN